MGRKKRRKRERDLQIEYKNSFTNNTKNINNKRNKTKHTKPMPSFPGAEASVSCQQLLGSTRKSWAALGSRQELDSGMHRSESGSGTQASQGAGSSSEAGHG